jgi:hypothetical protein
VGKRATWPLSLCGPVDLTTVVLLFSPVPYSQCVKFRNDGWATNSVQWQRDRGRYALLRTGKLEMRLCLRGVTGTAC